MPLTRAKRLSQPVWHRHAPPSRGGRRGCPAGGEGGRHPRQRIPGGFISRSMITEIGVLSERPPAEEGAGVGPLSDGTDAVFDDDAAAALSS